MVHLRWLKLLQLAMGACLIGMIGAGCNGGIGTPRMAASRRAQEPTPAMVASAAVSFASATPAASPDVSASVRSPWHLSAQVDHLLAAEGGIYGVVIAGPDGAILYSKNADVPFVAASLYKLLVMADCYQLRAAGQLRFTEQLQLAPDDFGEEDEVYTLADVGRSVPVDALLYAMITHSSNVAARALSGRVGVESINAMAQTLNMRHTRYLGSADSLPGWPPEVGKDSSRAVTDEAAQYVVNVADGGPVNVTTPRDVTAFFSALMNGKVVGGGPSKEMLQLLMQQKVNDRFPALLPPGTALAHKTGDLDEIVHDAGIIYTPTGPIILTALVQEVPDRDRSIQVIQRLALLAYGIEKLPPFATPTVAATFSALDAPTDVPPEEADNGGEGPTGATIYDDGTSSGTDSTYDDAGNGGSGDG